MIITGNVVITSYIIQQFQRFVKYGVTRLMGQVSDQEIHKIVEKIVRQTLSGVTDPPAVAQPPAVAPAAEAKPPLQTSVKNVAIGTDHGGVELKEILVKDLKESGYEVIDCGTNSKEAVDYPDFAFAVARLVSEGKAWRGVVIDGAGIGSCMTANKVPGVRAAMCYDYSTAVNSREHNDANVLTLGAGLIGVNLAKQILKTWLTTDFGGGRHAKRVDKIMDVEKRFLKDGKG